MTYDPDNHLHKILLADAVAVNNETGLSPRELQQQRDELVDALRDVHAIIGDVTARSESEADSLRLAQNLINKTLAKAKGEQQ